MQTQDNLTITRGKIEDAQEIFALYRSLVDSAYGTWDEEYPSLELVKEDLSEGEVFVMRDEAGRIVSAIAVEHTDDFGEMADWYPDVTRWGQLGRLGVAQDMQGHGIARRMIGHAMARMKEEGYEAVRFIAGAQNVPAIRSYSKLGFDVCGETQAWGERWLCYEKRL